MYFHFKIADCSLLRDSAEAALKALQGVAQLPSLTPTEQVRRAGCTHVWGPAMVACCERLPAITTVPRQLRLPCAGPWQAQVLHQLARAFLYLHACKYDSALVDLGAARDLLDALPDQDGVQAQQLRAHMLVLGAAVTLARGALMDLCLGTHTQLRAVAGQVLRSSVSLGSFMWERAAGLRSRQGHAGSAAHCMV